VVLRGVNFEVNPGEYLCVVGENGSGKSTLIKGLLGLKEKSGGEILIGDGLFRTEIGYLRSRRICSGIFRLRCQRWCSPDG
jgi:zinc transport system ATP-binding protein